MASLFDDVASLVNVTDLLIERPTLSDYGGDVDSYAKVGQLEDVEAIVERRSDLVRNVQNEEVQLLADIRIAPTAANTAVEEGDVASWSDYAGTVTRAEVLIVEPWGIGTEDAHIRLRVGRAR